MSNLLENTEQPCNNDDRPSAPVIQHLTPREADIGGVTVRRVFPTVGRKMVGPWVFFDEMGPVEFAPGPGINVPPHPHIGLATVTYLFAGEILHRDSLGSVQPIQPGDINLMVAGQGVVHSERERDEATTKARTMHGLQLWLALPESEETCEPSFQHIPRETIPSVAVDGVPVRVLIGEAYGVQSPVPTFSTTLYMEATMTSGQLLKLPDAEALAVYVVKGQLEIAGSVIQAHSMAVIDAADAITVAADCEVHLVVIGGDTLGKRHINWNFVSSSRARISAARDDWEAGRFAKVPGDEDEYVPLPG